MSTTSDSRWSRRTLKLLKTARPPSEASIWSLQKKKSPYWVTLCTVYVRSFGNMVHWKYHKIAMRWLIIKVLTQWSLKASVVQVWVWSRTHRAGHYKEDDGGPWGVMGSKSLNKMKTFAVRMQHSICCFYVSVPS